jgi:hypothetical protein
MMAKMRSKVLHAGVCLLVIFAARAGAQMSEPPARNPLEVAVTYNPMLTNTVGGYGFSMQGGSVQVHGQFFRGWGVVADVSGLHANMLPHSTDGLDLVTADFGPRYTWSPVHHRLALFGQFLVGEAFGMNSIFPSTGGVSSRANGLALQVGGGINVPLSTHVGVRAFEADWLRTALPNSTTNIQNNLRLGVGIFFCPR